MSKLTAMVTSTAQGARASRHLTVNVTSALARLGALLVVVGGVIVWIGWHNAETAVTTARQTQYLLSGGFLGIAVVTVGVAVALTQVVRAERQALTDKLDEVVEALAAIQTAPPAAQPTAAVERVVAGTSVYHRTGCRLVPGAATSVDRAAAADRGLRACRVCKP